MTSQQQPSAHLDIRWQMGNVAASATFDILPGVTALIGPSGAGKTTLARIFAGLNTTATGCISLFGQTLLDSQSGKFVPASKRQVGFVMQDPALFPTLTVADNIALGSAMTATEHAELHEITGTGHLLSRMPASLSGGEARRVAIVRAMAAKPRLLILDEPMNGLDPKRRREIMQLIRRLAHSSNTPVLLITHQLEEMLFAADHAVLVDKGHIQITGSVEQVLSAPKTAELLGVDDAGSLVNATISGREDTLLVANIGGDLLYIADDNEPLGADMRLRILARDIALSPTHLEGISVLNQLEAEITSIERRPNDALIRLSLIKSGQRLESRITLKSCKGMNLKVGSNVYCLIKAVAVKELISDRVI